MEFSFGSYVVKYESKQLLNNVLMHQLDFFGENVGEITEQFCQLYQK